MQKLKVFLLRWFYRWANKRAWSKIDLTALDSEDLSIPGSAGHIPARIYRPPGNSSNALIIYMHGGGWVLGDLQTHDPFCRRLALESGATVVALDYRLAPEHPCPAAAIDCIDASKWLLANQSALGLEQASVFVAGDSTGANLSAVVANHLCEQGDGGLTGQILIYPVVRHYAPYPVSYIENGKGYGLTKNLMTWFWDTYLGGNSMASEGAVGPMATPLFENLPATLPPALVVTAGLDPLRDEGAQYAAKLDGAGIPCLHQLFNSQMHGFVCSEGMTDGHAQAMQLISQWMVVQQQD